MVFSPRRIAPAALVVAGLASLADTDTNEAVAFPAEYRKWAVVRSLVVGPESKNFALNGGFHHYYANEQAMEGFHNGRFPDGSIVVDERLELRQEAGNTLEGSRKSVAVMAKDAARYSNTGGWGFDLFAGEERTQGASSAVRTACFTCHTKRKDQDFVFSAFRK